MGGMDKRDRTALWTLVWVMFTFKAVTALMILVMLPGEGTLSLLIAMHVPWFVGAAALVAIPGIFWYRLVRVRAKRKRLIWEEWHVEPSPRERSRAS